MSCDPQTLITEAACIQCQIPDGMKLPVLISLFCKILENGGTGSASTLLFSQYTDVSTTDANEDDLYSNVIPGNTLVSDGQVIAAQYSALANAIPGGVNVVVKFYFGGTLIGASPNVTNSSYLFRSRIIITRTSATTARVESTTNTVNAIAQIISFPALFDVAGLDWSNGIILKMTGQTTNAANVITAQEAYANVIK